MLVRIARGDTQVMPAPLDRPWPYAATLTLALVVLAVSLRGLPWYFGAAGLGGVIYLASAAYFVPTLGVAIFFGATTAGSVLGALVVDQFGAFGAAPTAPSIARVSGLALIVVGVVVARLGK
jgi:transporter family-2 protein